MTDLINGKTPEEIKRRLQCAIFDCSDISCDECQYPDVCASTISSICAEDALALIEHLEAKIPKWISVKERLPEKTGKYIVCTRKKAVYCTAFRFFHDTGYFATDTTTHITHWMPLPEPPKEERK